MRMRLSLLGVAGLAAAVHSGGAIAAPPVDLQRACLDGGLPYPVGSHLCTSTGIVEICLRPDQSYGVKGIFTVHPATASGFDKAHWIATTSNRCGPGEHGKVYRSSDPRR